MTREVAEVARRRRLPVLYDPRRRHRQRRDGWRAPTPTSPGSSRTCRRSPTTGGRRSPSSTSWCPAAERVHRHLRGPLLRRPGRRRASGRARTRCCSAPTARSCTRPSSWPRSTPCSCRRRRGAGARRQPAAPDPSRPPGGRSADERSQDRRTMPWLPESRGGTQRDHSGRDRSHSPGQSRAGPGFAEIKKHNALRACTSGLSSAAATRLEPADHRAVLSDRPTSCRLHRRQSAQTTGMRSTCGVTRWMLTVRVENARGRAVPPVRELTRLDAGWNSAMIRSRRCRHGFPPVDLGGRSSRSRSRGGHVRRAIHRLQVVEAARTAQRGRPWTTPARRDLERAGRVLLRAGRANSAPIGGSFRF